MIACLRKLATSNSLPTRSTGNRGCPSAEMLQAPGYSQCKRIGAGSYGTVFRAVRDSDGLRCVLKQVQVLDLPAAKRSAAETEVALLASLQHPHVVRYQDSFHSDGALYIVMELCDGGDLQAMLARRVAAGLELSAAEVWCLFLQVVLGLEFIHRRHVLHRDLKSANLFLSSSAAMEGGYCVKLGDFGVARELGTASYARTLIGTPAYLSPELCEDEPYNQKSDIWALGVVLFECLSMGGRPFEANNQCAMILKIVKGSFAAPRRGHGGGLAGREWKALLHAMRRLLHRRAGERPTACAILDWPEARRAAASLALALPSDGSAAPPASVLAKPSPRSACAPRATHFAVQQRLRVTAHAVSAPVTRGLAHAARCDVRGTRVRGARQQRTVATRLSQLAGSSAVQQRRQHAREQRHRREQQQLSEERRRHELAELEVEEERRLQQQAQPTRARLLDRVHARPHSASARPSVRDLHALASSAPPGPTAGDEEGVMEPLDQWPQEDSLDDPEAEQAQFNELCDGLRESCCAGSDEEDFMQPLDQWPQEDMAADSPDDPEAEQAKLRDLCDGLRESCSAQAPGIFDTPGLFEAFREKALSDAERPLPPDLAPSVGADLQRLVALEQRLAELKEDHYSDDFEEFEETED